MGRQSLALTRLGGAGGSLSACAMIRAGEKNLRPFHRLGDPLPTPEPEIREPRPLPAAQRHAGPGPGPWALRGPGQLQAFTRSPNLAATVAAVVLDSRQIGSPCAAGAQVQRASRVTSCARSAARMPISIHATTDRFLIVCMGKPPRRGARGFSPTVAQEISRRQPQGSQTAHPRGSARCSPGPHSLSQRPSGIGRCLRM